MEAWDASLSEGVCAAQPRRLRRARKVGISLTLRAQLNLMIWTWNILYLRSPPEATLTEFDRRIQSYLVGFRRI